MPKSQYQKVKVTFNAAPRNAAPHNIEIVGLKDANNNLYFFDPNRGPNGIWFCSPKGNDINAYPGDFYFHNGSDANWMKCKFNPMTQFVPDDIMAKISLPSYKK